MAPGIPFDQVLVKGDQTLGLIVDSLLNAERPDSTQVSAARVPSGYPLEYLLSTS